MTKQLFVRADCDDVVVVKILEPELSDLVLQDQLQVALMDLVQTHQPKKLVVDLSEVEYCATGVINTFLLVRNLVIQQGGEFKLCSPSGSLLIAFRSLKLEKTVFSIHASAEEAVQAFDAPCQPNG